MNIDFCRTHTLLAAVEQLPPQHTFLRDRYFPTNPASDVFSTEDVLIEYREGSKKLAPFVMPRKGGLTISREGYEMRRYTPPFIAPRRSLTIDDLNSRGFGEALFTKLTPQDRQNLMLLKDAEEMGDMITRREEFIAAQTLLKNGCVMRHYADNLVDYEEKEIRFYSEGTNPATYTPSVDWDAGNSGKLADLAAIISMLTSRGLPAEDFIVSPSVGDLLLADANIQKLLDNRNYNVGVVDPLLLPAGASRIARLNIKGRWINVIEYGETYTADDGTVTQFIPDGYAILTAPNAGRLLYGAVSQVEQEDRQVHTYTGRRIPKYLSDATANTRSLTISSRPLAIPNNKNPWISMKLIGND